MGEEECKGSSKGVAKDKEGGKAVSPVLHGKIKQLKGDKYLKANRLTEYISKWFLTYVTEHFKSKWMGFFTNILKNKMIVKAGLAQ